MNDPHTSGNGANVFPLEGVGPTRPTTDAPDVLEDLTVDVLVAAARGLRRAAGPDRTQRLIGSFIEEAVALLDPDDALIILAQLDAAVRNLVNNRWCEAQPEDKP